MKALTLMRPWNYAFTHCGKDVENRTWKCNLAPGTAIALHAGAASSYDKQGADFIRGLGHTVPTKAECPSSAFFAVVTFQGNVTESDSPWFFGPFGWTFSDLFVLPEPVEYSKGALGLWTIPAPQLTQIMKQLPAIEINK